MRPVLVVGLGNPLSGDDGVGILLARRLAGRLRVRLPAPDGARARPGALLPVALRAAVEVVEGGTDLLRLRDRLEGRRRIILLDALLDDGPPGRLLRFDGGLDGLDVGVGGAHQLSPVHALSLLRQLSPGLAATPVTFLGVTIEAATVGATLSPGLARRLPDLDARLQDVLRERIPRPGGGARAGGGSAASPPVVVPTAGREMRTTW